MKNKTEIMKSVNGMASKTVMKLKKHSPEILVVAGIAGTVVSAVLACKATTKVAEILDETKGLIVLFTCGKRLVPVCCNTLIQ